MKRTILVIYTLTVSAIFLHVFHTSADALIYTFDHLAPGTYLESDFNMGIDGVNFENTGGSGFFAFKDGLDICIGNTMDEPLAYNFSLESSNKTIATFDNPTNYVSLEYDTRSPFPVYFSMRAYDSGDSLLTQVERWADPADLNFNPPFGFLQTSYKLEIDSPSANIAYVKFWSSDGNFTNNADGTWDNFSFSQPSAPSPTPSPEPTTAILLSLGLAGGIISRRKSLKKG